MSSSVVTSHRVSPVFTSTSPTAALYSLSKYEELSELGGLRLQTCCLFLVKSVIYWAKLMQ